MNNAGILTSSVSVYALLCFAAEAHTPFSDPAHPNLTISPEAIANLPSAKDKYRQRVFNVILKPDAEAMAEAVQNYFKSFGFRAEYHAYTNSVKLYGTYAQAEQAGGFVYVEPTPSGITPRAPYRLSTAPHFPASISGAVLATTFEPGPVMDPHFTPSRLPVHHDPVTGNNVGGLAPADYGTLYGYSVFYNSLGINGAGETVDIAACFGYLHGATQGVNDDITIFAKDFGLSPKPNITAFYPSGHGKYSYSGEPLLDLSRVYGTAPGAAIRIWFSPSCTFNEFTNLFLDIANDQATHPAAAFTVSYGLPELLLFAVYGSGIFIGMDAALSKITGGASQKVALFASSGDNGDESLQLFALGVDQFYGVQMGTTDVLFPASDFNVLAVGGTTVFPVSPTNVTRFAEYAWSGATLSNLGGSGGGISALFATPPWQKGVAGTFSQTFKNVPDVSSNASVESGPLFVVKGALQLSGGTSAASPTLAGTVALIRQAFQVYDQVTISNWPAVFYENPEIFTDIKKGSNGFFTAGPGYDNVTGIGVPCLYGFFNTSLCVNNN
jgi:subtilase family serine protease